MLVVTPQFAASAGLVIAAMMAIDMPHASLSYGPNPEINTCAASACRPAKLPGQHKVTTFHPGVKLHQPRKPAVKHTAAPPPTPTPPPSPTPVPTPSPHGPRPYKPGPHGPSPHGSQVTLRYRVVHRVPSGGFVAIITIRSHPPLRSDWELSFELPGARVQHVWGATWHQGSSAGAVVLSGQPWPWPGQRSVSSRVAIFATGSAPVPAGCQFDGTACSFS